MSEHVEVLERLRGVLEHGRMEGKRLISTDLVEKAIAALSAPAEAHPVGYLSKGTQDGEEAIGFRAGPCYRAYALPDGDTPLYAHPPPSAPVGVTHDEREVIETLLDLAYAAWSLADSSEDAGGEGLTVERTDFAVLEKHLDALSHLPDDRPGHTLGEAAKARWALRRLLSNTTPPSAPVGAAEDMVLDALHPPSSGGEFRFTPSESDRNRCYNCGLRLADHVPDDDGARCKREAVRQLREITAPPSAPVEVAGSALIDLIEGAGCARWQNEQGFRLKDTPEWVAFYNATKRALAQRPAAVDEAVSLDTERFETIKRRRFGVVPVEGGGWDVYVYAADCGKETLVSSARDVRHAIDEAIAAQQGDHDAYQQGGES